MNTLSESELQSRLDDIFAKVSSMCPAWRTQLSDCCLWCSAIPPRVEDLLHMAESYQFLLDGRDFRSWATEEEGEGDDGGAASW